jgi:hypothetical protein
MDNSLPTLQRQRLSVRQLVDMTPMGVKGETSAKRKMA